MLTFRPSFRRLLRKYIPQLRVENLNRHERLFALRHELLHEIPYHVPGAPAAPRPCDTALGDIGNTGIAARNIFRGSEAVYNAVHDLWIAQRRFAAEQGDFFQIPTTFTGVGDYFGALWNYGFVWTRTFPTRSINVLRNYRVGSVATAVATLLVIGVGFCTNQTPSCRLPDWTIDVGHPFQLNIPKSLPSSPVNPRFHLKMSPGNFLTVDSLNGLVQGTPGVADVDTHQVTIMINNPHIQCSFKVIVH